jgi:transporter family-2 protein
LTAIILVFPRLGPGLGFGLIIAGQLIASVALEHFNILARSPIQSMFCGSPGSGL